MTFPETRISKIIATITLSSFIWVFLGLNEIAVAGNDRDDVGVLSAQDETGSGPGFATSGSETGKAKKKEERFEDVLEHMRKAEERIQGKIQNNEDINEEEKEIEKEESEIDQRDIEIRQQFRETEEKSKDLPEEIKQRHRDFVQKYEENYRTLKADINDIKKARTKEEKQEAHRKAKEFLEKVRPHKKHISIDPENLPNTAPKLKHFSVIERSPEKGGAKLSGISNEGSYPQPLAANSSPLLVASAGSLDGLLSGSGATVKANALPTEADLSETIEVQFTPEIMAKAEELENKPVKLYEWIMNNFTYEPYYGSLKGAQQTLLEKAGNDFDQASLLIALLRASGIPARYVYGTIELPIERLMNWLGGIEDPNAAATIMATNGIPGTLITEGGVIKYAQFEHVWVEAYVDMFPSMGAVNIKGDSWTPIDPSMKEYMVLDTVNVSDKVNFNEFSFFNRNDKMTPVLSYIYMLQNYYYSNYDYDFQNIFHASTPIQENCEVFLGTLPYKVLNSSTLSTIQNDLRWKISFEISWSDSSSNKTVSTQIAIPELTGKEIEFLYVPASEIDFGVIEKHGGLLKTPSYLFKVNPVIAINGNKVLSGENITLGTPVSVAVNVAEPNNTIKRNKSDVTMVLRAAIGVSALNYIEDKLFDKLKTLREFEGTVSDSINLMDSRVNEVLQNIVMEYFKQLNITSGSIESFMHIQNTKRPSVALVSVDVLYDQLFGVALSSPIINTITIDAIHVSSSPVSLDGDLSQRKKFIKHRGLNSSYLEHYILESILGMEAISSAKALQIAANNDVPLYTIDKNNIDEVMPKLTIAEEDKTIIQNEVNSGNEVIVSRDTVTYKTWTGVGYITRNPQTGSGAYMISGSLNGGSVVGYNDSPFASQQKIAYFVSGNNLDAFNYPWQFGNTLQAVASILPAWQAFGYTTSLIFEVDKDDIIRIANDPNTWIFNYTGHGWNEDGKDYIKPQSTDIVYPKDITGDDLQNADVKIVFLNACGAASTDDFYNAFTGGDRLHGIPKRDEALIGFSYKTIAALSDSLELKFWLLMGTGVSIDTAVALLYAQASVSDLYHLIFLEKYGYGETTLLP